MTVSQLAVLMPAVIFLVMLSVQYGLWFHAKQVAAAAAAEGVDVAQVAGRSRDDAEAATRTFLAQSGNLREVTVEIDSTPASVTVTVRGQAPHLVPGLRWSVASVAHAPIEQFVPQPRR